MKTTWMKCIFSLLTISTLFSFSPLAHAQSAGAADANLAGREYDEAKETAVSEKARKRLYPGGKDESDLKVQSQLTNPVRKLAPNMELSNGAEPSSED